MTRVLLLPLALVVSVVAAGCHNSRGRLADSIAEQPTPNHSSEEQRQPAIAAVMASPRGRGLGAADLFPTRIGSPRCIIHGGGPAPGLRIDGICTTDARCGNDLRRRCMVVFTETWAWRKFHYSGAPQRRQHHS